MEGLDAAGDSHLSHLRGQHGKYSEAKFRAKRKPLTQLFPEVSQKSTILKAKSIFFKKKERERLYILYVFVLNTIEIANILYHLVEQLRYQEAL